MKEMVGIVHHRCLDMVHVRGWVWLGLMLVGVADLHVGQSGSKTGL